MHLRRKTFTKPTFELPDNEHKGISFHAPAVVLKDIVAFSMLTST